MFLPHHISQAKLQTDAFGLKIWMQQSETKIEMKMTRDVLYSSEIPQVKQVLQMVAPNVLLTRCFNDKELPFDEEVLHTEMGHLFEHLLLDRLCEVTVARESRACKFSGVTTWDWKEFGRGVFHITLNVGWTDRIVFYEALHKTCGVMNLLLRAVPADEKVLTPAATVKSVMGAAN